MAGLVSPMKPVHALVLVLAAWSPATESHSFQAASAKGSSPGGSAVSEQELFESVLPMPSAPERPFLANLQWIVTFRVRPTEAPEFWARARVFYGGNVVVDVTSVEVAPLATQLQKVSETRPAASLSEVEAALALRHWV